MVPWMTQVLAHCYQSYQCSRRAWRNADSPSITRRMDTVRTANRPNTGTRKKTPRLVSIRSPTRITMVQSTSDSSVKAEKSMCTIHLGNYNKQRLSIFGLISGLSLVYICWLWSWLLLMSPMSIMSLPRSQNGLNGFGIIVFRLWG